MEDGKKLLETGIKDLGLPLTKKQEAQFFLYYEMLAQKNSVMNLTTITDVGEVVTKHFLDSLLVIKSLNMDKEDSVIDVGTGAGFPGIPIKVMFPHIKLVLVDSVSKKLDFIKEAANQMGLSNVTTVHARAEDLAKSKDFREKFDVCVSRAVADLSVLAEYCIPFVKVQGKFVAYKTYCADIETEDAKKSIAEMGGEIQKIVKTKIPKTEIGRAMILVKKVEKTPGRYPRRAGVPAKKPIK